MPERSSRNNTNDRAQPKQKEKETSSLPQIKIDIKGNNEESGEITRSVKYNHPSTEKAYDDDEPCYESD